MTSSAVTVSVIIPVWNGAAYLAANLSALLAQRTSRGLAPEVIAVDNASSDNSLAVLAGFPAAKVVRNAHNQGFAGGCNRGIEAAAGAVIVLLNQDTVVQPGWLAALVDAAVDPAIGAVGCKILYPDGNTLQHAGAHLEWPLALAGHSGYGEADRGQWDAPRPVEFVTGAALATRRDVLAAVGLLDEGFWPGYFEDADFCLRAAAAGLAVRYEPQAVVLHQESTAFSDPAARSYYYQCGRLRLALKHLAPARWHAEFVPAEERYLPGCVRGQDGFALELAYTHAMVMAPALLGECWQADRAAIQRTVADLDKLYRCALAEREAVRQEMFGATVRDWPAAAQPASPIAGQTLASPLTDMVFASRTRLVGPILGRARHLWYNVAARWGDHHLRAQQEMINQEHARTIDLLRRQVDQLIEQNVQLAAELAELRKQAREQHWSGPTSGPP